MMKDASQTEMIIFWLLIGGAFLALVVLAFVLAIFIRTTATKAEVKALENEVDDRFDKQREISRDGLGKVHARIDSQSSKIGALMGKADTIDGNINLLKELLLKSTSQS